MQFSSLADFIAMDGHGFYVWLSYGISIFLLSSLVFFSLSRNKKITQQIQQREKRELKLKQAAEQQKKNIEKEVTHESTS
jgi:heme exporter protein D